MARKRFGLIARVQDVSGVAVLRMPFHFYLAVRNRCCIFVPYGFSQNFLVDSIVCGYGGSYVTTFDSSCLTCYISIHECIVSVSILLNQYTSSVYRLCASEAYNIHPLGAYQCAFRNDALHAIVVERWWVYKSSETGR